jgi:hypothetical protein
MTASPRQGDGPGWAMTTIRRVISRLRYVNDELVRAHEAMALPTTRAAWPGPGSGAARLAAPAHEAIVRPGQPASAAATAEGDKPAA